MRKETRKYYFSVEGETEHWYLNWLQNTINAESDAIFDRESEDEVHVQQFYF